MTTVPISASPKYATLTKWRYRILFTMICLGIAYVLPYSIKVDATIFRLQEPVLRLIFLVLSIWTLWSTAYRPKKYRFSWLHNTTTLANIICAALFMFLAIELRLDLY